MDVVDISIVSSLFQLVVLVIALFSSISKTPKQVHFLMYINIF